MWGTLYSAFLAMHRAAGVPGILAALALGYNTNLFGAITHYSSGQAAVYYGGLSPSIMSSNFCFSIVLSCLALACVYSVPFSQNTYKFDCSNTLFLSSQS